MIEILQYDFMKYALVAAALASVACGIVGTYVVTKRIVFISGGISHAAFGGIGIGYFLGISPVLGAVGFCLFFALLLGAVSRRMKQREDTVIGVLWAAGMAVGILFVYMTEGYAPDLMSYLFGNILSVTVDDVFLMAALDVIIVACVLLMYNEFFAVCFDEEFASVRGVNVERVNMVLLCMIALTVVILIKVVGIILVIAMLSVPAAISGKFSRGLKGMMVTACFLSVIFVTSGLFLSYAFDLPSGAVIVLVSAFGFLAGSVFAKR